jgi:DNA mismatch repair ATPase MutL
MSTDASKVSGKGHFISVDSRPVSCARGVLKQILVLYKDYIRSALRTSSALRLINPFICMNIKCPTGSYDANIEPAKDDVLFEDSSHVLFIMESFFKSIYGKLETAKQGTEEARKSKTDAKKDSFELLLARKAPVVQEPKQAISSSGAASTQKSGREIDSHAVTTSNQSRVKELEQNAHDRALAPNPYTVNDSIDHEKPQNGGAHGDLICTVVKTRIWMT